MMRLTNYNQENRVTNESRRSELNCEIVEISFETQDTFEIRGLFFSRRSSSLLSVNTIKYIHRFSYRSHLWNHHL